MCDAKVQATKLLKQHSASAARRVAAETAMSFKALTEGRVFWMEVLERLVGMTNMEQTKSEMYQGSALDGQQEHD